MLVPAKQEQRDVLALGWTNLSWEAGEDHHHNSELLHSAFAFSQLHGPEPFLSAFPKAASRCASLSVDVAQGVHGTSSPHLSGWQPAVSGTHRTISCRTQSLVQATVMSRSTLRSDGIG